MCHEHQTCLYVTPSHSTGLSSHHGPSQPLTQERRPHLADAPQHTPDQRLHLRRRRRRRLAAPTRRQAAAAWRARALARAPTITLARDRCACVPSRVKAQQLAGTPACSFAWGAQHAGALLWLSVKEQQLAGRLACPFAWDALAVPGLHGGCACGDHLALAFAFKATRSASLHACLAEPSLSDNMHMHRRSLSSA